MDYYVIIFGPSSKSSVQLEELLLTQTSISQNTITQWLKALEYNGSSTAFTVS